tara:strand:+ start:184 stop:666 length:483 start_codon:yes stop_codon:yes gene_type:complete
MSTILYIDTKFIDKSELIAHIRKSEFYKRFVKILKENPNSKNHRFVPKLDDEGDISNPQNLYYTEIPNFSIPFVDMLELDIHQKWEMNDESFHATITVKLKDNQLFKIDCKFRLNKQDNNYIKITMEGRWEEKIYIVPNFVLDHILNQIKFNIKRLLEDA